ncbi:hypothetical protein PLESTB_001419300 [Pleodorina starrii]|uniref:protein-serine/threonine phosphatase n=1 Tax=Pleodorina starrii TaxID=330485 RepID=A0A9W6BVF1_9CHLO|nr:hypothetical protein PLESTM_001381200 [Pleodorina starrii]GLC58937.1 hypothetical protein PLESTB_001419300 [Pleodorina starrii]GLC65098.1 hypothetical protein PLESTF_000246400 [Pleodorina starrii]
MSVQLEAEPCAFHLNRTLTLDPSGLAPNEGEAQLISPCRILSRGGQEPPKSEAAVCFQCPADGTSSSSPPPTPFVSAAAVSKEVVSAFQRAPDLLCSPGSCFRHQDTIVEPSSSGEASLVTPEATLPRLNGTLSTPMERGSSCAADAVAPQPLTFQRQSSACLGAISSCPAHGVKAVCGKRNKMEDMYAVQPNFCDIPLSPTADEPLLNKLPTRIAVQLENADQQSPTSSAPLSPSGGAGGAGQVPAEVDQSVNSYGTASDAAGASDTLHFFGVYDGHGGCQAAEHCARRLHHHLSKSIATACGLSIADGNQLLQAPEPDSSQVDWSISSSLMQSVTKFACLSLGGGGGGQELAPSSSPSSQQAHSQQQQQPREKPQHLLAKASVDSDSSSGSSGPDDHALYPLPENDAMFENDSSGSTGSDRSDGVSVSCLLEEALKEAFVKTDAEFANDGCAAMVGSTALVALVGTRKVWLANCGDSRAVLCRAGKAIQLTDDHKPEREDEAERVEKAGGQVLFWNGHRVMGVLAMSRAIGDHGLRPYIIPEPEVSVVCRRDDDDFLLLASDGLWDVMANQEATNLCIRCIKRAREKGASRNAAVRIAASVLTKAAIDRGSKDNVTVVIVDLRNERPGAVAAPTQGGACANAVAQDSSAKGGANTVAAASEEGRRIWREAAA